MKRMKFAFDKILVCLLCVLLLGNSGALSARAAFPAATEPAVQQVFLDHYELTDERIIPGKEFSLKLFLKNVGEKNAEHVIVDVIYPLGTMPVYGSVSQAIVDVPADETSVVELKYKALETISAPILDFQVSLRENELKNQTVLRTSVGLKSPFEVVSFFVPSRALAGESVNCSMTFKYLGMDTADRISARMNVNGVTAYSVDMGNLTEEATKTQTLTNTFEEAGSYSVDLYLDYYDDSGAKKTIQVGSGVIEAASAPVIPAHPQTQQVDPDSGSRQFDQLHVLIISGILILVISAIIVFLIKKKK